MKLGIGNDHAGTELKKQILDYLIDQGHNVINFGTDTTDSVDYPEFGHKVAVAVQEGKIDFGIVICGTGIGIGLAANKVPGIRCAMVSDSFSAKMARKHNNCQMISFGSRVVGFGLAKEIVNCFLDSSFDEGRHTRRVDQIEPNN